MIALNHQPLFYRSGKLGLRGIGVSKGCGNILCQLIRKNWSFTYDRGGAA